MSYQTSDGKWHYQGSTQTYASQGAANYYGPTDSSYQPVTKDPITGVETSGYGTNVKEAPQTGLSYEAYGINPLTGTQTEEKAKAVKETQMVNPAEKIWGKEREQQTEKEMSERGIIKINGRLVSNFAERKKAYKKQREEGQAQYEYEQYLKYGSLLGKQRYVNPYSGENPYFPLLASEAQARDIKQRAQTLQEVGEGGQVFYAPKGIEMKREIQIRKGQTAQLALEYQMGLRGNPQISEQAYRPAKNLGTTTIQTSPYLKPGDKLPENAGSIAQKIEKQALKEGAESIQIYNAQGEPVGGIAAKGSAPVLENLLTGTSGFSYRFATPKEKYVRPKEGAEFNKYLAKLQKNNAIIDVINAKGEVVATTGGERSRYDILRAAEKEGEVTISPRYTWESLAGSYTNVPEKYKSTAANVIHAGYAFPKTLQSDVVSFASGVYSLPFQLKQNIEDVSKNPKLLLEPFKTYEQPKEAQEFNKKYSYPTLFGTVLSGQPNEETLGYNIVSGLTDVGTAVYGLKGVIKNPLKKTTTPKGSEIGLDIGSTFKKETISLGQRNPAHYIEVINKNKSLTPTPKYRSTNPYRTPLGKDILEGGEPTPTGSASRPPKLEPLQRKNPFLPSQPERPPFIEDVSKETQKRLSKLQEGLISKSEERPKAAKQKTQQVQLSKNDKPGKRVEPDKAIPEELLSSGKPPIEKTPIFERPKPEEPPIRSERVEATRPKARNEVYSSSGKKLNLTYGEISEKDFISPQIKKAKAKHELPSSYLGQTKRIPHQRKHKAFSTGILNEDKGIPNEILAQGKSPLKTIKSETEPSLAKKFELSRIKPSHEVYTSEGKKISGTYGDTTLKNIIELAKKIKPKENLPSSYLGQTKRTPKVRKNKALTKMFTSDQGDLNMRISKNLEMPQGPVKRNQARYLSSLQSKLIEEPKIRGKPKAIPSSYLGQTKRIPRPRKNKALTKSLVTDQGDLSMRISKAQELPLGPVKRNQSQYLSSLQAKLIKEKKFKTSKKEPLPEFYLKSKRVPKPRKNKEFSNQIFEEDKGEFPQIGEPQKFKEALKKNPLLEEKPEEIPITAIKTKDISKARKPSTQDWFKEERANLGLDIGKRARSQQILLPPKPKPKTIQPQIEPKPNTNPLAKKPTKKREPIREEAKIIPFTSREQDEEQILHQGRPRARGNISPIAVHGLRNITSPSFFIPHKVNPRIETHKITKPRQLERRQFAERITQTEKERTMIQPKPIQIFKPKQSGKLKQELLPKYETLTMTKQITKPKQATRQRITPIMPTPIKQKPRTIIIPKRTQKPVIPNPPPTRLVPPPIFGLPTGPRKAKPKPTKGKPKYNFLGNVPVSELTGTYKREDIIYGKKRINKLVRADIQKSKRGNFLSRSKGISLASKRETHLFTKNPKIKTKKSKYTL